MIIMMIVMMMMMIVRMEMMLLIKNEAMDENVVHPLSLASCAQCDNN